MSVASNPVALFPTAGLLAFAVMVLGTSQLIETSAANRAVSDARDLTGVLVRGVLEPAVADSVSPGRSTDLRRLDDSLQSRLRGTGIANVTLIDVDGNVVYAEDQSRVGSQVALSDTELTLLRRGGTAVDTTAISLPRNVFDRSVGGTLLVMAKVGSASRGGLIARVEFPAAVIAGRQHTITSAFSPITLGSLCLIVLVASGLLYALTRRLYRSAADRERLLMAALESSEVERLRIARDLHDGVVQDLAGASFAVAALARHREIPDAARADLDAASTTMRVGLKSLRSLMVEIYPPDLRGESLEAALQDLIAPAESRGIDVMLDVAQSQTLTDTSARLVWRVAQEAIRNTIRHSGATHLAISLIASPSNRGQTALTTLQVLDDGVGFDSEQERTTTSFGLRGIAGLAKEAGGVLVVDSAPGRGTRVRLDIREGSS